MKLWRVSDHLELDGEGGFLFVGRWHSGGRRVVYSAEHSALALLEVLVQLEFDSPPDPYQLLEVEAPESLDIVDFAAEVPTDIGRSQEWGDNWLASGETALARVPSAIAPEAFNYLINPAHPAAPQVRLVAHARYDWDARLFR